MLSELDASTFEGIESLSTLDLSSNPSMIMTSDAFNQINPTKLLCGAWSGSSSNEVVCSVSACFDECGNNTKCSGILTNPPIYTCSCMAGFNSQYSNGSDCQLSSLNSAPATSFSSIIGGSVGGALGFFLLIVIVIVVIARHKRYQIQAKAFNFALMVVESTQDIEPTVARNIPREIKRPAVRVIEVLGKGNFGEVSKGFLSEHSDLPGYLVAIKVLHQTSDSAGARTELLTEASVMAQFNHLNIVCLIGVVTKGDPLMVVLEYCEKGALDSFLDKNETSTGQKLHIASACAEGLEYLSSLKFIHRDIASRNVLLGADMTAKIADFGMSRASKDKNYYVSKGGALAVRWTAPEALEHQKFSEKSDVWSYGILLYEIWTKAKLPYDGMNNQKVWIEVAGGYRLPCPDGCLKEIHGIMQHCWDEPSSRPPFSKIVELIDVVIGGTERATARKQVRTYESYPKYAPDGKGAVTFGNAYAEESRTSNSSFKRHQTMSNTSSKSTLVYLEPDDLDSAELGQPEKEEAGKIDDGVQHGNSYVFPDNEVLFDEPNRVSKMKKLFDLPEPDLPFRAAPTAPDDNFRSIRPLAVRNLALSRTSSAKHAAKSPAPATAVPMVAVPDEPK